jgi:hypothetical protein
MIWLLICYLWTQPLYGMIYLSDLWYSVPPSPGENWGVVISPLIRHQTWWTSVPDRATTGLEIWTPLFKPSWSTVFDRIISSSSCVASFFTDLVGLVMYSIWKDHHMTSIFVFYAFKFLWWITRLPSIEKSFISCIALSWLPSFSGEWWTERAWSQLCASSSLKLQSRPEVTRNQSDTCSDFIVSTSGHQIFGVGSEGTQIDEINLIWTQDTIFYTGSGSCVE